MRITKEGRLVAVLNDSMKLTKATGRFKNFWSALVTRGIKSWQGADKDGIISDAFTKAKPSAAVKGLVIAEIEQAGYEVRE